MSGAEIGDEVGELGWGEDAVVAWGHEGGGGGLEGEDLVAGEVGVDAGSGGDDDFIGVVFFDEAESFGGFSFDEDGFVAPDEAGAGIGDGLVEIAGGADGADFGEIGAENAPDATDGVAGGAEGLWVEEKFFPALGIAGGAGGEEGIEAGALEGEGGGIWAWGGGFDGDGFEGGGGFCGAEIGEHFAGDLAGAGGGVGQGGGIVDLEEGVGDGVFEETVVGGIGGEERGDGALVADAAEGFGGGSAGMEIGIGEEGEEGIGGGGVAMESGDEGGGGAEWGFFLGESEMGGGGGEFGGDAGEGPEGVEALGEGGGGVGDGGGESGDGLVVEGGWVEGSGVSLGGLWQGERVGLFEAIDGAEYLGFNELGGWATDFVPAASIGDEERT